MRRLAAVLLLTPLLLPERADACGGLFCGSAAPVFQTGEGIIFSVDSTTGTVQAIINIRYQGPPSEFAWLLPLQSAPMDVGVAPSFVFNVVEQMTAPRFPLTFQAADSCLDENTVACDGGPGGRCANQSNVQVIEAPVGPYDSAVIESSDPEDARRWLIDNGYSVTDEMFDLVTPYVAQGDALLALKLQKNQDTGDIQPIALTMSGSEVCIPLRLTAIAATDDMDVTALVLSNEGRAIPENYNHVVMNLLKLDWSSGGTNYRSLVAAAADEASGNAFVTEYAGRTKMFEAAFYDNQYSRVEIEATTTVLAFLGAVKELFYDFPEVLGIVARHLPDSFFADAQVSREVFILSRGRIEFTVDQPFDPKPATQEIWERVIEPLQRVQRMFDQHRYATRLYTRISPAEMTVDPTFIFDPLLPEVSNVHQAKLVRDCGGLKDQTRVEIAATGETIVTHSDRSAIDAMPAALRIEQLAEHRLIADNSQVIADLLESNNAGGCDCSAAHPHGSASPGGLLLVALLVLRRFRSRA